MLLYEQVRMRELPSLIDALCKHLKENGYSEYTIRRVRGTLKRFCRFADENGIDVYDNFAVQSFITFSNGDDYQDKYYSYSVTRPFSMIWLQQKRRPPAHGGCRSFSAQTRTV